MTKQKQPINAVQEVIETETDTHFISKSTGKHATTTVLPELLAVDDVPLTVVLMLVAVCIAMMMVMVVIAMISCRSFRRHSGSDDVDDRDDELCGCYCPLFSSVRRQQVERTTKRHHVDCRPPHGGIGASSTLCFGEKSLVILYDVLQYCTVNRTLRDTDLR